MAGGLTLLHDESEFTLSTDAPANLQIDGDLMGQVEAVHFRAVPRALTIIG